MTMLDRMRQHKNWLKWSLGLVCLTFILFYIPDFLQQQGAGAVPSDVIAAVEGRRITVGEFQRVYLQQIQLYRDAYGGNLSDQMLRQMGLERQVLQQMVDEHAALEEAGRLGLTVSDAEVRERIVKLPAFQENGGFVGEERYKQILRMQRPPLLHTDFEEGLRRSLLLDKLRAALTEWISVTDREVEEEHRRRNEQVRLELVTFLADAFRAQATASEAELGAHFEANKTAYRVPEKRRIRFLVIDTQALREQVPISPQDVERSYGDNLQQYSIPEQVRASHILLKTEGKEEAAVRKQAEAVLAEAESGADFAELARKYSEDEPSKANGGDLDFFGRGRMVPEFEQVAFSLEPGRLSDLVKTQYGFHIIKVTEKREPRVRPIEEVRQQIVEQLKWERAQARADQIARDLADEIDDAGDLNRVAQARGLTAQESGFFVMDEPILGLGPSPEVNAEAFRLAEGELAGPLRTAQGYAFIVVTGKADPYVPKLDEVKERVRDDVIRKKAAELARQKAESVAATLKQAVDFAKAAKEAGLEPKSTGLVARGAPVPDLGASDAVERMAFSLPVGATSDPISTDNGTAIIRVAEHKEASPSELAQAKDTLRDELLTERRTRFFNAYMGKAKQRMEIEINRNTLQQVAG